AVAGGCMDRFDGGVTSFGAELIARMDELGIIIDMSHSGRQATLDACQLSRKPVVVSHAPAAGVYDIPRARRDDAIRAVASTGGVIGVVAVPGLLTSGKEPTIEVMLDHIGYIARLVGWRHVAIGSDWPLQIDRQTLREVYPAMAREYLPRDKSRPAGSDKRYDQGASLGSLAGFDDYRDYPNITRGLVKRGYTDEQIRGILGENFLRVFQAVCG
ncbi:MAG: dipeptidase, partial [Blastocatellia bacterium]